MAIIKYVLGKTIFEEFLELIKSSSYFRKFSVFMDETTDGIVTKVLAFLVRFFN